MESASPQACKMEAVRLRPPRCSGLMHGLVAVGLLRCLASAAEEDPRDARERCSCVLEQRGQSHTSPQAITRAGRSELYIPSQGCTPHPLIILN